MELTDSQRREIRKDDPETTLTAVHHLLAHPTRRAVLQDLTRHYHPVAIHDLAARLTTDDADRWCAEDAFRECRVGLVHCHLPKLDSAGLIRYTADGAVTLTEKGFRIEGLERTGATYLKSSDNLRYPH